MFRSRSGTAHPTLVVAKPVAMMHSLVSVGITVAPIPVVSVRSGARSVELAVDAVF